MLDADFEVERREFTVRAALQVGPGERLGVVRAIRRRQNDRARSDRRPGPAEPWPSGPRPHSAHLDVAAALRCSSVAAPGRVAAPRPGSVPSSFGTGEPHVLVLR